MKMKHILLALLLLTETSLFAQFSGSAVEYMEAMNKEFKAIQDATWDYTKAAANNRSARKIDKKRKELIAQIDASYKNVQKMQAFNKTTYYKDSILSYLKMERIVIAQDYEKIMNLEDIAESSYDNMEAYFKAREIADKKLDKAGDNAMEAYYAFAKENKVNIIEGEESKMAKRLKNASEVYDYYNVMYLIFFKAFKQEAYLVDATNKSDVAAMEQNKKMLAEVSEESLKKFNESKPFRGSDNSLLKAGIDLMNFYKQEAEKYNVIISFFTKKENFEKTKKAFDANGNKSKEEVDKYNKVLEEYNKAVNDYNNANNEFNKNRSNLLNNWNKSSQNFTAKYI